MIDFWAEWCAPCKKLDANTFSDPDVAEEAKRFVALKIDVTEPTASAERRFREEYGLAGVPYVLFIDSTGERRPELAVTGYVGPSVMLERMRAVR